MPSYLILRVISFIVAVCVPMFFVDIYAFGMLAIPLTLAHYILAVPYSKKYLVNVMKRRSTSTYFAGLIAASILLVTFKIPGLLFVLFGIHYVFSEVYLMYDNVIPNRWKDTRALRVSSIVCNTFVYFASIRAPLFNHAHRMEFFNWIGYVIAAGVFVYHLLKIRKSLTKEQMFHACAFEALGLAFVITGMIHPISIANFIFYHVLFWVLYPSWKMIGHKQIKPLAVFLGSNIALTALFMLIAPTSPLPYHFAKEDWMRIFSAGALVHIIISLGMTNAQPAWITRIFHPEFARSDNSASDSTDAPNVATVQVVRQEVLQR